MKVRAHQLRWIGSIAVLAISCSFCNAAIVHKTDDTSVTGDLKSIADAKLTVTVKNAPVVISFDDIGQIVIKEPAAPVVVKPTTPIVSNEPADDGPNLGSALFGTLFSGAHLHSRSDASPPPVATSAPSTKPIAATQPFVAPLAQFTLTDGDRFHAKLLQWADQNLKLQLIIGPSLQIPSSSVTEIWIGKPDLQIKAKALVVAPGPEDVAFVTKENDVIAVKGLVLGIAEDSLQFRYSDQDRKIDLSKIVGLLLRSNVAAPLPGFHQLVRTDAGDIFSGALSAIDHDSVVLNTADTPVKILLSTVTTIDFINGRVNSLCDLKPSKVDQSPYFGRLMGYQIDKSLTGGLLVLSDGPCTRGIAVHSRCVLQYDLPGVFDRFKTKLGFAQPDGQRGRVSARILGDGKPLYENADARGNQPPIEIDVPLTGVHTLTLEIDFGKDQDVGDRVIWANPRLVRGK